MSTIFIYLPIYYFFLSCFSITPIDFVNEDSLRLSSKLKTLNDTEPTGQSGGSTWQTETKKRESVAKKKKKKK